MKKLTLSFWFITASVAYVFYSYPNEGPINISVLSPSVIHKKKDSAVAVKQSNSPNLAGPNFKSVPVVTQKSAQTVRPKPTGIYADGTYTGNQADAYYGIVQIRAIILNGRLASVNFLQYPNDRRTSRFINDQAMPLLESEAIRAQNANVDIVSGATATSQAFQESLADALGQAKI